MFMFMILSVVLLGNTVRAQVFTPISTETNTVQYGDGTTTQQSTATFQCTENQAGGSFQIGPNTFQVSCIPPRYTYQLYEVSRVPRFTQLHQEHACFVGDAAQYSASRQVVAEQSSASSRRRLLQLSDTAIIIALAVVATIAVTALAVGTAATVIANQAQTTANNAWDLGQTNSAAINQINVTIGAMQNAQSAALSHSRAQDALLASDGQRLDSLQQFTAQQILANNASTQLYSQLKFETTTNEQKLASDLTLAQTQMQAALTSQNAAFARAILNITSLIQAQQDRGEQTNEYIFQQIQNNQEDLLGLTTSVFDLYQNVQLRNMITASFFKSQAALDPALKPLLTDPGLAPYNNGQLSGADLRILVDSFSINFVTTVTSGGGTTSQTLVSLVYNIYIGAYKAVQTTRPWTTFQSLLQSIGPDSACLRPYDGSDVPESTVTSNNNTCILWVEAVQSSCALAVGAAPVEWKTIDHTQSSIYAQPVALDGFCPTTIQVTSTLMRSLTAWQNHINTYACAQPLTSAAYFQIYDANLNSMLYLAQDTSTCSMTLQQLQQYQVLNPQPTLVNSIFGLLAVGFPSVQTRVLTTRLKVNGRLPGGLSFETEPLTYTPTQYDANGDVIYDGGADTHMCLNAYWLAASRDTLPVMAAVPYPDLGVTKQVHFTKTAGPACNPSDPTCYTVVGPSQSTVQLEDDFAYMLPSNFLLVGDPALALQEGIYDVPDQDIAASPNLRAGINHVDYYNMPAGTTETIDLNLWNALHGTGYKAQDGSLSAQNYHIAAAADGLGYAYCNTNGGSPTAVTLLQTDQATCGDNTTHVGNYTFTQEMNECSIAFKQRSLASMQFYDVFDPSHPVAPPTATVAQMEQLLYGTNSQINLGVSWWFRIVDSDITSMSQIANTPNINFTLPVMQLSMLVVEMNVYVSAGVAYLCPLVRVGDPVKDPSISITIGQNIGSTFGHGCISRLDLGTAHHFYAVFDNIIPIRRQLRLWIDGIQVSVVYVNVPANTVRTAGTSPNPAVLSQFTGVFGTSTSALFTANPASIGYTPVTGAVWDMRVFRKDTANATYIDGSVDAQQLMACMPPRLFGVTCTSNYIRALAQDHQTMCDYSTTPPGTVLFHSLQHEPTARSSAKGPYSAADLQAKQAALAGKLSTSIYTLTFWLRRFQDYAFANSVDGSSTSPAEILAYLTPTVMLMYTRDPLASSQAVLTLCQNTTKLSTYIKPNPTSCRSMALPMDEPAKPVFIGITVNGDISTAVMYINAAAQAVYTPALLPNVNFLPNLNNSLPVYTRTTGMEKLVLRDHYVMSAAELGNEQLCNVQSLFDETAASSLSNYQSTWQTPMGVCAMDGPTSQFGYCRTPLLCLGNCLGRATINQAAGTFQVLSHVCDPGWLPPECMLPCPRIDPVTGYCMVINNGNNYQTGVIPNGKRCQLLKNFQENPTTLNGQRILTYTPRLWSYTFTVTVPSGSITALASTGGCPQVSVIDDGSGGLRLQLQNIGGAGTSALVQYYYTDPALQQQDSCTGDFPVCCDFVGTSVSVSAYTTNVVPIPSNCGNITVFVSLNNGAQPSLCTSLTADSVDLLLQSNVVAQQVATRVSVAVDTVAQAVTQTAQSIVAQMLQVVNAVAQLSSSNSVASDYVAAVQASISQITAPQLTFANNISLVFFNDSALLAQAQSAYDQQQQIEVALQAEQLNRTADAAAVAASLAVYDAAVQASDKAVNDLANLIAADNNITYNFGSGCPGGGAAFLACGLGGLADGLGGAVADVGRVASGLASLPTSLLSNLLGTGGGGILDGLLGALQPFLIIGVVGVAGYFAVTKGLPLLMQSSGAPAAASAFSGVMSQPQQAQPSYASPHTMTQPLQSYSMGRGGGGEETGLLSNYDD